MINTIKIKFIKNFFAFIIPKGQYCYKVINRNDDNFTFSGIYCKYYKVDGIRRYCTLLNKEDDIRLDQSLKICGINE